MTIVVILPLFAIRLASLSEFDVALHQAKNTFDRGEGGYINNFIFLHKSRLANNEYKGLEKFGLLR